MKTIGIRREDKNEWERRAPLVPDDIRQLRERYGIETIVQPSAIRIFSDDEYRSAGARIDENLDETATIFAIKEIPPELLQRGKTYLFFSHTIKGQPRNMAMLKRLMALRCNLIDYECICDGQNVRLIAFGRYAGLAGMIETLHAYGRKMELRGYSTPFERIRPAYCYSSLNHAKESMREIGRAISQNGIPPGLHPLTVGFAGYGKVSQGAQEMLDLLPVKELPPDRLRKGLHRSELDSRHLYKTVFEERDMVVRLDGGFALEEYYANPDRYRSQFGEYLAELTILVNCIYWTPQYPRIVTRQDLRVPSAKGNGQKLQIIGDISCDIEGSVEITQKATKPNNACYTYLPQKGAYETGIGKSGITVMAVDNLPCELPREASASFSHQLREYVDGIASVDFREELQDIPVADEIKRAMILKSGYLTPGYQYMADFL